MKAKLTLFSSAKQGFAVCDCELEVPVRGSMSYRLLSAVDRATQQPLDIESVLRWHPDDELQNQIQIWLAAQTPNLSQPTEKIAAKCAVPDDCPKAFARFYNDSETPVLPNLGWD